MRALPWTPRGSDVNPLDVFVWDSVKNKLNELPNEQRNKRTKLQAASMKPAGDQMADASWMKKLKRTCEGAPKRLRRIKGGDGATIIR